MNIKQGISLILLVITILVMIILAGTIVLTLNNSGIIQKTGDAVEQANLATVKELTQMAWASAYASGDKELDKLQAAVDKALEDNKVDTTKYAVEVTSKGVNVVLKGPWVQTKETVTDGKITINVGEKINYTATGTDYTGEWKVLGASKYGELLIMSDSDVVSNYRFGDESTTTDSAEKLKESQSDWLNAANELDKICEPYGKGIGATWARSIRVEDVDKITGFDKTTYGKDKVWEYGNEVTYTYNTETGNWDYTSTNNRKVPLTLEHSHGFHYYDGYDFVVSTTTAKLKNDYYNYDAGDLEILVYGSDPYTMLFGEDNIYYWLASPYVYSYTDCVRFGVHSVVSGQVSGYSLWYTHGIANLRGSGVRAVVSLDRDAKITANTVGGWNINK